MKLNDIKKRKTKICVVGIGQVGLRVCGLFASSKFHTVAYDIDKAKIEKINAGKSPIDDNGLGKIIPEAKKKGFLEGTTDPSKAKDCDFVIICVNTPVRDNQPDLVPLESAVNTIARHMKKNSIMVVESSIYPGVIDNVVRRILDKHNLTVGKDIGLAHCPERIDPGNMKYKIEKIPRVLAGSDKKTTELVKKLYQEVLKADVHVVSNIKTAEMIKLVENTFRDVNIALVNELAKVTDGTEIRMKEVIDGASTKPFAFVPHYPGPGVGGECIPVDPYWLIAYARALGRDVRLVETAREINDRMPYFIVKKILDAGFSKILVLGLTYKPHVKDLKNTPAMPIIDELKKNRCRVSAYDPLLTRDEIKNTFKVDAGSFNENYDCVLVLNNDEKFLRILKNVKTKVIFDTKNFLKRGDLNKNIKYWSLG